MKHMQSGEHCVIQPPQKIQVQISTLFLQHGVRISTFLFPCFLTAQVLMYDT